ncbi:MAG: DUF4254 domain-containing protein [bacterium]
MIASEEIIRRLDGWSARWNSPRPEQARNRLLDFLKKWRSRSGDWFEGVAKDFFVPVLEILPSGNWEEGFAGELQKLHFANHTIWHFEDEARRDDVSPQWIVEIKRGIDAVNQQRNNQMENIDEWVLTATGVEPDDRELEIHSEPPGLMLDRFSILSLKIYHYRCQGKNDVLARLDRQRIDLGAAFDTVMRQYAAGQKRFRIYRQFKTYNDPQTNPLLKGGG